MSVLVQGLPHYHTMSSQGVTSFHEGHMEFVSLEQFERDYFLYRQLSRLRMFRLFREWKAFRIWRRYRIIIIRGLHL